MGPKIWAIAWNNIYRTYTDRIALMFMILMPVAVGTVMGLAFGNLDGDIEIIDSKILVINQDVGATTPDGREVNWGRDVFLNVLVENTPPELADLLTGEVASDIDDAQQEVEDGDARAVLLIPPDFSEKAITGGDPAQLEVFYNPGSEVGATVALAVVDALVANLNNGQAAEQVLVGEDGYFIELGTQTGNPELIAQAIAQALPQIYIGQSSTVVDLKTVNVEGESEPFEPLQFFAPSMAIFFMTFAMASVTRGVLEEQQNWTLQRILTTPTPRWGYMAGKLLGAFLCGLGQMAILLVTMPLVSLALGDSTNVWGKNIPGVILLTLAVVAAATGLGLLLAAVSKTSQQADALGTPVLIIMAAVGGTFFDLTAAPAFLQFLSNFSLNKWGLYGYTALSTEDATVVDILPNAARLLLMAAIFFGIALWRFKERLDI